MSTLERLIQEAQALPQLERQKLIEALQAEPLADEREARLAAIHKARGSMKGLLPSTEEFLAEKHAELQREEK
ncbi:MAG TPA: hypothetical protein VFD58_37390 [Blastocatellia bacterium]|nr:hypothetical protein [Blastocatellia bacterium]